MEEEEEERYIGGRVPIGQLGKGKPLRLDASLTNWTNSFLKPRRVSRKKKDSGTTPIKN